MDEQNKQSAAKNRNAFEQWQKNSFVRENIEYYDRKWGSSSDELDAGWNWAGFLIGPSWAVYRKLYLEAAIVFAILSALAFVFPTAMSLYGWIFALGGNAMYRRKLVRIVKNSEGLGREEQKALLRKKGGTNPIAAAIVTIAFLVLIFVSL